MVNAAASSCPQPIRRYRCDACPAGSQAAECGFRQKKQLMAHRCVVHKAEELRLPCPKPGCLRTFVCQSKLEAHMRHHEPRSCEDCQSQFPNYNALRRHRAVEHRQPTVCPECGVSVSSRSWLRQHVASHRQEGPTWPCPYAGCGRAYSAARNLTQHVRSYHEGRRFHCQLPGCSFSFCSQQRLRAHLRLHDQGRVMPKPQASAPGRRKRRQARVAGYFRKDSASDCDSDSSIVRLLEAESNDLLARA